ncbi:MAG: SRPBCC domain-containing protein [Pedobacter sp.]|nr:SRPBCC domain-containing protein [Pedobacter sp.]
MKTDPLIIERMYEVSPDKIWRALTVNDELQKWYFKLKEFHPKVGFKFDFIGGPEEGPQYLHLCEITEIVEGKKIAYTWRYDNYPGNSTITWELFDQGGQTLLRLTHEDIHTFEENGPNFTKESFKGGWTYFVHTALKEYLENV